MKKVSPSAGWFGQVPACRMAAFRVAVITLAGFVPRLQGWIREAVDCSFHDPILAGLPLPPASLGAVLAVLIPAAAGALLWGIFSRWCAGFLAVAGFYLLLLDVHHFSHNSHFHIVLLLLLACSDERMTLGHLTRETAARDRCAAWPERLLRVQLVLVFFFAALDKTFNPLWGWRGERLLHLQIVERGFPPPAFQEAQTVLLRLSPGFFSGGLIGLQYFLAAALLWRPLWRLGVPICLGLSLLLELVLSPGLFPWDMLAVLLLFLPAADRRIRLFYSPGCFRCERTRRVLSRLDWLRRLRCRPAKNELAHLHPSTLWFRSGRKGRLLRGMASVFPGPVLVGLVCLRFLPGAGWFPVSPADGVWIVLLGAVVLQGIACWRAGIVASEADVVS